MLGLPSNSSFEEVKEAHKDLVNVWHPDRFETRPRLKAKTEQKLKEINEAYERLSLFFENEDQTDNAYEDDYWEAERVDARDPIVATGAAEKQRLLERRNDRIRLLGFLGAVCFIVGVSFFLARTRRVTSAVVLASVTTETSSSPSPVSPSPNTASPSSSPDDLESYLDPLETPTPKATVELDPYLVPKEIPTPNATVELDPYLVPKETSTPTPQPSPSVTPRMERLVYAQDVLSIGYQKREDSRRYRFQLDHMARIKGSISARGGGVTVRIFSGDNSVYVSGFNVSVDSIDLTLYPGVYELQVTLVATDSAFVNFSVNATAYY